MKRGGEQTTLICPKALLSYGLRPARIEPATSTLSRGALPEVSDIFTTACRRRSRARRQQQIGKMLGNSRPGCWPGTGTRILERGPNPRHATLARWLHGTHRIWPLVRSIRNLHHQHFRGNARIRRGPKAVVFTDDATEAFTTRKGKPRSTRQREKHIVVAALSLNRAPPERIFIRPAIGGPRACSRRSLRRAPRFGLSHPSDASVPGSGSPVPAGAGRSVV